MISGHNWSLTARVIKAIFGHLQRINSINNMGQKCENKDTRYVPWLTFLRRQEKPHTREWNPKTFLKKPGPIFDELRIWGTRNGREKMYEMRYCTKGIKNVPALPAGRDLDTDLYAFLYMDVKCGRVGGWNGGPAPDRKQTTATYSLRLPLRWLSLPFGYGHCHCYRYRYRQGDI